MCVYRCIFNGFIAVRRIIINAKFYFACFITAVDMFEKCEIS